MNCLYTCQRTNQSNAHVRLRLLVMAGGFLMSLVGFDADEEPRGKYELMARV
jgi:hypothetical protein